MLAGEGAGEGVLGALLGMVVPKMAAMVSHSSWDFSLDLGRFVVDSGAFDSTGDVGLLFR